MNYVSNFCVNCYEAALWVTVQIRLRDVIVNELPCSAISPLLKPWGPQPWERNLLEKTFKANEGPCHSSSRVTCPSISVLTHFLIYLRCCHTFPPSQDQLCQSSMINL